MSKPLTWKNDTRKLGDLIPWDKNPRKVTDEQAEHLKASLKLFGLVYPPLISPKNHIYDGHQREKVMAMMDEYTPETLIDVRVSSRMLTKKERLELVARLHENTGDWVPELVAELYDLEDLEEWGAADMADLVDWDEGEIEEDPGADVDKAEELREKWGVESGQLWQLGDHRVVVGDCTDPAVIKRLMGGENAYMMMTDPPYGIDYGEVVKSRANQKKGGWDNIENDSLSDEELSKILNASLHGAGAVVGFVFHPAGERRFLFWDALINNEWKIPQEIVWVKNALVFGRADYQWRHEPIMYIKRDGAPKQNDRTQTTVWEVDKEASDHPTAKPVELYERAIRNHTTKGKILYDPFLGIGPGVIACERLKRKCYGAEIKPEYVAVALERWHQLTGEMPELTGETPDMINGKEEN